LIIAVLVTVFVLFTGSDRSVLLQNAKTFDHNGTTRSYLIREPSNATADSAIVVGLHGFNSSARAFAYYSGVQNTLPETDIILYPQAIKPDPGQKPGWNAGFCCGSGYKQKYPDAEFILALIEQTKRDYGLQNAKVFVAGFSNGAFMAQRLASEYPDKIDAVVSASGTFGTEAYSLEPKSPVPILLMHGEQDTRVTFEGGASPGDPEFVWKSHEQTVEAWQAINGADIETKVITYPNDGHKWHDWRLLNIWHKTPQASIETANFFSSYR